MIYIVCPWEKTRETLKLSMAGGRFHQEHENGPLNPFMVLERKVGNHTGRHYYFKKLIPAREV